MRSLWLLTIKNLRLLLRSKGSALIIIFAPLLIILLLGLSFNTSNQYGLNIGVYSSSYNEDVNSFIDLLQEEEFTIIKYEENSIEGCVEDIKSGEVHACVHLPENLKVDDNSQKEVVFYIDPSKINLVWMIQENVQSKFNLKSQEISQELAQETLGKLSNAKNVINEKRTDFSTLKEKTSSAASSTSSTKESLTGIDTGVSDKEYNTTGTLDGIDTGIVEGRELIEDAISSVNSAGIEDDTKREELRGFLLDAKKELNAVLATMNGNDSNSVGGLIDELQGELDDTRDKLNSAATTINSANSNLDTVSLTLGEATSLIASLQTTLDEVHANLESQKVTEAGTLSSPLITKIEKVSEEGTYLNYLFPALLVLVVMFSSLLLGTTLVMIEKNSPAYLRNFFVPVRRIAFMFSIYLTNLILIIVELAVILGISLIFMKDSLSLFPSVALVLFIAASVFTFTGMAIGYIFTSEETGVLASISLGSVFLLLSGTILPLETVSPLVRGITYFNPFVLAEKLIREIFIFATPLADIWIELVILSSYAVVLFIVIAVVESIFHKHFVSRFMRKHHRAHRQKEKRDKLDI